MQEEELLPTALAILHLGDRQRFRLFVRRDPFERFLSCLIYVPRENYTTELRQKWQAMLAEACNGTSSDFYVQLSESMLARVQIIVRTTPGKIPPLDVAALEARLAAVSRRWTDDLRAALVAAEGEARGSELHRRYAGAFPAGYREDFAAAAAVGDVALIESLRAGSKLALALYRPAGLAPNALRFKLLRAGARCRCRRACRCSSGWAFASSTSSPYRIAPAGMDAVSMHDFGLAGAGGRRRVAALQPLFAEAFAAVVDGEIESDDFNRLSTAALLPAREVVVLRAYAKYMKQAGFSLSQSFIEAHARRASAIARRLVEPLQGALRSRRSAPRRWRAPRRRRTPIEAAPDEVENLSEDRVLRQYLALIQATTRTNYWRRDEAGRPRIVPVVQVRSGQGAGPARAEADVRDLRLLAALRGRAPARRPRRARRAALVRPARGLPHRGAGPRQGADGEERRHRPGRLEGRLRAEARAVDGGPRGLPRARAWPATRITCAGLLDLTDNRVGGKIVPPPEVKRHDADDPYLVVAADKGTATFSDHANAVSAEYGFWLGDAFASGGSAGYDHKEMGITARGAWEAAKRHFRELGRDIQTTDFTVVGIGDMSGDVFGNGMLLSRHIRLVAAFDHRHIFLDPDPDPATSFAERERLFRLPRSSWADYDASLHFRRRRRPSAQRQVDPDRAAGQGRARRSTPTR